METEKCIAEVSKGVQCSGSGYKATPPSLVWKDQLTMVMFRPLYGTTTCSAKGILRMSSSAPSYRVPFSKLGLIDEERSPNYNPQKYYPCGIGESVGKYRILSKLGWGASSTAWLAEDTSR